MRSRGAGAGILLAVSLLVLAVPPGIPGAAQAHHSGSTLAAPIGPGGRSGSAAAGTVVAVAHPGANPCSAWNGTTFTVTLSAVHSIIDIGTNLSLFVVCRIPAAVQPTATVDWNWTNLPPGCGASGGSFVKCKPTLAWSGVVKLTGIPTGNGTSHLSKASDTVNVSISNAVVIQAGADPRSGPAPLTVNFTVAINGGSSPFTIEWLTGDQNIGTGRQWDHTYSSAGTYVVQVWVNDTTTPYAPIQVRNLTFTVNVTTAPRGSGFLGLHGSSLWIVVGALLGLLLLVVVYLYSIRHRPPRLPRPERWMVPDDERPGRTPWDPKAPKGPGPPSS